MQCNFCSVRGQVHFWHDSDPIHAPQVTPFLLKWEQNIDCDQLFSIELLNMQILWSECEEEQPSEEGIPMHRKIRSEEASFAEWGQVRRTKKTGSINPHPEEKKSISYNGATVIIIGAGFAAR